MATVHSVQQGEHLSEIAQACGFRTIAPIWDHPQNADLRSRRGTGNVLLAGDQLFIPDKVVTTAPRSTGARHRFRARTEMLHLRLTLLDIAGAPMADAECQLTVEGKVHQLVTDGQGWLDLEIPRNARSGLLTLSGTRIPIQIGSLDPIDEGNGTLVRLINLGYYRGPLDPVDEAELLSAIEEFQCDTGLEVTGACDESTLATLQAEHGC
jgi:hypothetical protein